VKRAVVCFLLAILAAPGVAHGQESREGADEPPVSIGELESFDPPAWRHQQHGRPLARVWFAPSVGRLPSEDLSLAGASVAFGLEAQYSVSPTLNTFFYGSAFGLEARWHALRTVDGATPSWLIAGGLALTMNVTEHGQYSNSRVRFPSLFGLMVPEAGVAVRSPQPRSSYLRWSAPVAVLIEKHVAIELVPSLSLLYQGAHGGVEALWMLGAGVSWRAMGQPMRLL
jgi:hypothetical protein